MAHGDNPNDVPEEERTKLVKLGKDARSGRFGGEGTGGQSFVDYPWAIGENMRFLVCVKKMGKFKEISGYYFNNKSRSWDLISKWKTHSSEKELSFSVGFVEDFMRNFESAKKARGAFFGPSFAYKDGKWHPNTSVTFTGDPTPPPTSWRISSLMVPCCFRRGNYENDGFQAVPKSSPAPEYQAGPA